MTSIGAKLAATTILAGTLVLSGCSVFSQPNAKVSLNDAPATQALLAKLAEERANAPAKFAANAERARLAGEHAAAVDLAEHGVALDPASETNRRVLAQAYFSAGRFEAANGAWDDILAMNSESSANKLGAAIAAIAVSDEAKARALLADVENDPARAADVGLAYVLLGDAERGIRLIEHVVRAGDSTARTRQNLAVAQALAGNWNDARETAAIDLTPVDVEVRVAEWAALAVLETPGERASHLLKIDPVAGDPGRPVELAYVAPVAAPVQFADAPVVPAAPAVAAPKSEVAPQAGVVAVAAVTPDVAPVVVETVSDEPVIREVEVAAATDANPKPQLPPAPAILQRASTFKVQPRQPEFDLGNFAVAATEPVAAEAAAPETTEEAEATASVELPKQGDGEWLVQLGSYLVPEDAKSNWNVIKSRTSFLADYKATRSRTVIDGTDYFRLSVGRFETREDAVKLCDAVKEAGESCFVRAGNFKA